MKMRTILAMCAIVAVAIAVMVSTACAITDAQIKVTKALHNGAGADTTAAIDTGKTTTQGSQMVNADFVLTAPALTTTELPDTRTVTYKVVHSVNADLSSSTDLYPSVVVQTGAGGAGAAAATFRFRIPSDAKRYIGVTATVGASGGDCSGKSMTLDLDFK